MKFPKTLYVHVEGEDTRDGAYFSTHEQLGEGIDEGKTVDVAIYEMKEIRAVTWSKAIDAKPSRRKS